MSEGNVNVTLNNLDFKFHKALKLPIISSTGPKMNFQTICRVCLGENSGMLSIFQSYNFSSYSCKIFKVIRNCASVQIEKSDGFSEQICRSCLDYLSKAFSFKKLCEDSDYKFRNNLITTDKIKSEFSEEDTVITYDEIDNNYIKENTNENITITQVKEEPHDDEIKADSGEDQNGKLVTARLLNGALESMDPFNLDKSQCTRDQPSTNPTLPTKPFECDVCAKKFRHQYQLKRHSVVHSAEKPYKCDICHKRFSGSRTLRVHTRLHSGEKQYKCEICDKKFAVKGDLVKHVRLHTGERPYECDVCHKTFTQSSSRTVHMRSHSGEKPYNCVICHRSFTGSGNFRRHMRLHSEEKLFECVVCEERFSAKSHLVEHMKLHWGKELFKCDVCQKNFTKKRNLQVHMRLHSAEKPLKCHICYKTFTVSSNLKVHMRVHSE